MPASFASITPARRRVASARARQRRLGSVSTWAVLLVATLAFKSFVPLLAALSAGMQGKAVADVCAVYGVRIAPAAVPSPDPHAMHHMHGAAEASMAGGQAMHHLHGATEASMAGAVSDGREPPPADHAEHARDHCALTALAVGAMLAATLWGALDWRASDRLSPGVALAVAAPRDASARWLTLRVHAPPARA